MGREPLFVAALVASSILVVGCKSKPEKICANLAGIISKESPDKQLTPEDKARCVADIQLELDQCENAETIASCYVEATNLDAIATCESKCQKKLAPKGAKPGASGAPASPAASTE